MFKLDLLDDAEATYAGLTAQRGSGGNGDADGVLDESGSGSYGSARGEDHSSQREQRAPPPAPRPLPPQTPSLAFGPVRSISSQFVATYVFVTASRHGYAISSAHDPVVALGAAAVAIVFALLVELLLKGGWGKGAGQGPSQAPGAHGKVQRYHGAIAKLANIYAVTMASIVVSTLVDNLQRQALGQHASSVVASPWEILAIASAVPIVLG